MKKVLLLLVFTVSMSCFLGSLNAAERIVAVVNSDIITQTELDNFARFIHMQLEAKYSGRELEERFAQALPEILNRLIENKLIIQEAKKAELKVDQDILEARIEEMRQEYGSEKELMDDLIKNGLTLSDVRTKLQDQMLMYEIINTKVRSRLRINPSEVTDFYEKHKEQFIEPVTRSVLSLVTDDKSKANEVVKQIKNGGDFEETATSFGLDVNDLGKIEPGQFKKELDQVISVLRPGEVSDVVQTDGKYYIFKLVSINESKEKSLEEISADIYNFLMEQKMQEEIGIWIDELRKGAYIDIREVSRES